MSDRNAPEPETESEAATPGVGGSLDSCTLSLPVLRKRADFLRAARARRDSTPGFMIQARKRGASEPGEGDIRVGYTCSKKVGNAVARNRAKRRLRALARSVLAQSGKPGWDYVLIGRAERTASRCFATMQADLESALARLHRQ